jgi:hypothetical protein
MRSILCALGDHAGVSSEDTVDVGVDLADLGVEGRRHRHGRRVRSASAERRDVAGVPVESLEPRDDRDVAVIEGVTHTLRGHLDDAGGAVLLIRHHAGLAARVRARLLASVADGHREECHRDALASREEHVELATRRLTGDGVREVEKFVGRVTHGRHDDHDIVAGTPRLDDALCDALDASGVCHGRTAVLLHNQGHAKTLPKSVVCAAG